MVMECLALEAEEHEEPEESQQDETEAIENESELTHTSIPITGTLRAADRDGDLHEWTVGEAPPVLDGPLKRRRYNFEPMPEANVDSAVVSAYGFVAGDALAWAYGAPTFTVDASLIDEEGVSVEAGGGVNANPAAMSPTSRSGGENMRPPPERKPNVRDGVKFDFGFDNADDGDCQWPEIQVRQPDAKVAADVPEQPPVPASAPPWSWNVWRWKRRSTRSQKRANKTRQRQSRMKAN